MQSIGKELKKRGIHAGVCFNLDTENPDPNFIYITGVNVLGIVVHTPTYTKLFVAQMEREKVKGRNDILIEPLRQESLGKELKRIKRRVKKKLCIACDFSRTTHSRIKLIQDNSGALTRDIKDIYEKKRKQKTPGETAKIKKACALTDTVFKRILEIIRNGDVRTDAQLKAAIVYHIMREGCSLAFDPLVASGKDASVPHHEALGKKLKRGFLVIDMGVRYKGFCSDMTRTLFLGNLTQKEKERYQHVKDVQEHLVSKTRPSVSLGELDREARDRLGEFPHALGHGIGLCAHETPRITKESEARALKGMTLAIEPGMYKEGSYGIRIEDTIHVGERTQRLTKTPRTLITIQ